MPETIDVVVVDDDDVVVIVITVSILLSCLTNAVNNKIEQHPSDVY